MEELGLKNRMVFTFFFGLIFTLLTFVGLVIWKKSEWFSKIVTLLQEDSFDGGAVFSPTFYLADGLTKSAGYNVYDFLGLMLFTFAFPIAVCLLFTVFQYLTRTAAGKGSRSRLFFSVLPSVSVLAIIIAICLYWSRQVLACGIVGCLHSSTYQQEGNNVNLKEGSVGFNNYTSIMTLLGAVPILVAVLANFFSNWKIALSISEKKGLSELNGPRDGNINNDAVEGYHTSLLQSSKGFQAKAQNSPPFTDAWSIRLSQSVLFHASLVICCVIFTALCMFLTTFLPNGWSSFTPLGIARKALLEATAESALCKVAGKHCPEVEHATFRTFFISSSEYLKYTFFPGNVMMYAYIALLPILALAQRAFSASVIRFLNTKIRIQYRSLGYYLFAPLRFCGLCGGNRSSQDASKSRSWLYPSTRLRTAFFSVREIIWIILTVALVYCFSHYWLIDHNFHGHWPRKDTILSERVCRGVGQISVLFFSLLMFPAARNSPMYALLGLSWEGAMKYHRWLGFGFLLTGVGHMLTAYWWYYMAGVFPGDVIDIPMKLPSGMNNFTIPHAQWVMWFCIVTLGIMSSFESIRRRRFELFLICHHLSFLTLIPALLWHAAASWQYMLPGCALWLIDRSMRFYRSSRAVSFLTREELDANRDGAFGVFTGPKSIASPFATQYTLTQKSTEIEGPGLSSRSTSHIASDAPLLAGEPGASVFSFAPDNEVVELVLHAHGMSLSPGHYVFLNVAEVSLFEWHPFTVSSVVSVRDGSYLTLHIKTMGEGSWTNSLAKLIRDNSAAGLSPQRGLTVSLDGPHGQPLDFTHYDRVLLVSGGIGLTPCKAIYEGLLAEALSSNSCDAEKSSQPFRFETAKNAKVHMLSVARQHSFHHLVRDSAKQLSRAPLSIKKRFSMDLFVVRKDDAASQSAPPSYNSPFYAPEAESFIKYVPRPSVTDILKEFVDQALEIQHEGQTESDVEANTHSGAAEYNLLAAKTDRSDEKMALLNKTSAETSLRTLVFVCGPESIVQDCETIANTQGWTFHKETFDL